MEKREREGGEGGRETDRQTDRQTERQRGRDRQIDRQRQRETDRETDTQTDREGKQKKKYRCVLPLYILALIWPSWFTGHALNNYKESFRHLCIK